MSNVPADTRPKAEQLRELSDRLDVVAEGIVEGLTDPDISPSTREQYEALEVELVELKTRVEQQLAARR